MTGQELAERCENATEPRFEGLFAEAFAYGGRSTVKAWCTFCVLCDAEAWLDAAMTLVRDQDASDILHEAWSRLSAAHALHVRLWKPEDGSYAQNLACFVVAAALRAPEGGLR